MKGNKTQCDICNSKAAKKARMKKEREQQQQEGGGGAAAAAFGTDTEAGDMSENEGGEAPAGGSSTSQKHDDGRPSNLQCQIKCLNVL